MPVPALVATSTLSTNGRIESLTPSSVLTTVAGDWLIASVWCGFIYDLGYDALGEPLPAPAGWTSLGVRWIRRTTGSVVFSYRQGWYGVVGLFARQVSGVEQVRPVWQPAGPVWGARVVIEQRRGGRGLVWSDVSMVQGTGVTYPLVPAVQAGLSGVVVRTGVLDNDSTAPAPGGAFAVRDATAGYVDAIPSAWCAGSQDIASAATAQAVATTAGRFGWLLSAFVSGSQGPGAPTITAPTATTADLSAGLTVLWTPDADAGVQSAWAMRRRSGAGAWAWWNGSTWASSTEQWVSGAASSLAVSGLSNGSTWDIEVATKGDASHADASPYTRVTVAGYAAPAAPSLSVAGLSGGSVATVAPVVTVGGSAGSGSTFTGLRIEWLSAGLVVSATTLPAAGSWTTSPKLTNGTTYTVRAAVVQNGDQVGPWTSLAVTTAAPTPPAPAVSVSATSEPTSGLPGASVVVTTAWAGLVVVELERDGVVVGEATMTGPSTATFTTFLLTPGQVTTLRARIIESTYELASPWSSVASYTLPAEGQCGWLFDPLAPQTAAYTTVVDHDPGRVALRASAAAAISSPLLVVRSDVPTDRTDGQLSLRVADEPAAEAVLALLGSGARLMLRLHQEPRLGGGEPRALVLSFRPVGDVAVVREFDRYATRTLTFSFVHQRA